MPLAAVDGMAVTTVEGLGNTRTGLNIVQVNSSIKVNYLRKILKKK